MAEWRKRARINNDVIYFQYEDEEHARQSREVYLWDVDKTYLDTRFETFRGLWRTATEKATQKKNVPGTAELVRAMQDAWSQQHGNPHFPIFFVTASPPQMEKKIREKLRLDGIRPMGIFTKDNLPNLMPRRFWRLNKQVGYKLQALLQMRTLLHPEVRLILFGDDGESDAVIYSLFSDICSRRLNTSELRRILNAFFVLDDQVDTIFRLQDKVPSQDPVDKIYINLADDTDADYYIKFGRRILPTINSFQAALDLFQDNRLNKDHIAHIAQSLLKEYDFTVEEIEQSIDDLVRRERFSDRAYQELIPFLQEKDLLHSDFNTSVKPKAVVETRGSVVLQLEGAFEPWVPERIDYLHDYR